MTFDQLDSCLTVANLTLSGGIVHGRNSHCGQVGLSLEELERVVKAARPFYLEEAAKMAERHSHGQYAAQAIREMKGIR